MFGKFSLSTESGLLRISIVVTLAIAALGIGFGLASGSHSIIFDGVFSLFDASMSLISLIVANLITSYARAEALPKKLRERFSVGFWHLEPMVLLLNGILLIGVAVYGLVNAVSSLLEGGRDLEFGLAIAYAVIVLAGCAGIAVVEARANRRIRSDFVALDVTGWIMSAGITASLLAAFILGLAVGGTGWDWITPYIDPLVLALVSLVIIPMPVATIRRALADILLVTPSDLRAHVERVAAEVVTRHGFVSHRAYIARAGRLREIELYVIVPPGLPARTLEDWDALRDEIGAALGEDSPDRWLTIAFTTDREWAE